MIDRNESDVDPFEAVIAFLRSYALDRRDGSVEVVFATGGVPVHIHERRTTYLRRRARKTAAPCAACGATA